MFGDDEALKLSMTHKNGNLFATVWVSYEALMSKQIAENIPGVIKHNIS